MLRAFLIVLLCLALPSVAQAQIQAATYETLTVSTVAVSIGATTLRPTSQRQMEYCQVRVETDDVRFRIDGTAPTSAIGVELSPGDILQLFDLAAATAFRVIRSGSDDATLAIVCWRPTPYSGMAGFAITTSGGGAGAAVTQYTENDTDAAITGNALMLEAAGDTLVPWPGTAASGGAVQGSGSAGTPAGGVLTVQGVSNMTPIDVNLLDSAAAALFPNAAALADNTANPTTTGIAAFLMCFDGTLWDRCTSDDSNVMERYISVGTTEDENEIKATAGTLVGISARNAHATANAFIKCTNLTAANTTPGTSTIFYEMIIPAGGGNVDRDINAPFSVALTCYLVLGKADNAVDEVAATDVSYNLTYR